MTTTPARYRKPWTAAETAQAIERRELLLPGLQRSFVWKRQQIYSLFDSLMCGYPIGAALVWRTRKSEHPNLRFRPFIQHWDGSGAPKPTRVGGDSWVDAVLDGQQRLTALYIGLAGTYTLGATARHAELYLDLESGGEDPGPGSDRYRFEFRSNGDSDDESWFRVGRAVGLATNRASLDEVLAECGIVPTAETREALKKLAEGINKRPVLRFDVEADASLERALNVFTRTNTGGTKLSYVDLLISVLTARWAAEDARRHFEDLRSDVNAAGRHGKVGGFQFSIDRLVKASLVLLDSKDTRFHVDNFTRGSLPKRLEDQWDAFATAMVVAAETLAGFGLSARTMPAENVLIPVAYYAKHRQLTGWYPTAHKYELDRRRVRAFVARTLLTRRYWTGAVDDVLRISRDVIKTHGADGFPLGELEDALRDVKPIDVAPELIDELVELPYSDRRTLVLLRLLFPDIKEEIRFDKDHIFPRSCFSYAGLRRDGIPSERRDEIQDLANLLPNLQLLDQADNTGGKRASMPKPWLADLSPAARARYTKQFVTHVPDDLSKVEAFWDRRHSRLRTEIEKLLMP